jgi:hypothetical protein
MRNAVGLASKPFFSFFAHAREGGDPGVNEGIGLRARKKANA